MDKRTYFKPSDRVNGNLPQPEDYPLAGSAILDRMDAVNAELRAIKQVVYADPRYGKAREPMANAIRNMILVEGYLLNVDSPLPIIRRESDNNG